MKKKLPDKLGYYWRLACYIGQRFYQDSCSYRAATLTFTLLLSLVPLMTVSIAIITAFPMFKAFEVQVQHFIFTNFVPTAGERVQQQLEVFANQASHLSWVGIVFLMVTAILMMFTIERAFNAIWKVRSRRSNIATFLVYWAVLSLSPILVGVSFAFSDYLFSLPWLLNLANQWGLSDFLIDLIPFVSITMAFTFLYVAIPNAPVKIYHGLIGGIVAAILFESAKNAFAFYMKTFPTYTLIYGTLATVPIFLIWIYLSWNIILLGAQVTNALAYKHNFLSGTKLSGFHQAFRWIGYLWRAQQNSQGLSLAQLVQCDPDDYTVDPTKQLQCLKTAGFIKQTTNNEYVLACDISKMSLFEFYQRLPWRLPNSIDMADLSRPQERALYNSLQLFEEKGQEMLTLWLPDLYQDHTDI